VSVSIIILIVASVGLLLTTLTNPFNLLLSVLDLALLKLALAVGFFIGVYVAAFQIQAQTPSLAGEDAAALATSLLFAFLIANTFRYRAKDARETEELLKAREAKETALRIRGVTTAATIQSSEKTGWTVNDEPQYEFELSFELHDGRTATLTQRRYVGVMDAPRLQDGKTVAVTYDRDDPENFEVHWDGPADGGIAPEEPISATGATLDYPLWAFGMEDAEEWLLPPRGGGIPVLIIDITDPYDAEADERREVIVDLAAFVLAEHLWVNTDNAAGGAAMVNLANKKLVQPTGSLPEYEELLPFINALDVEPIVVWGSALEDLEREGLKLKLRLPGDEVERSLSGPALELGSMLADWVQRQGHCAPTPAPAWHKPLDEETLQPYSQALHDLQLQILADKKNEALGPLDADVHTGMLEAALASVEQHGDACPQLKLLAATIALYARRADKLPDALRRKAIELVLAETDEASAIFRLSPHYLRQLEAGVDAHTRLSETRRNADRLYADWLDSIEQIPPGG
jgi:hypothetical protein